MAQILLIGHGISETQNIRAALESHFPCYQVKSVQPHRQEIQKHLNEETRLTVLNYTAPLDTKKIYLQSVRDIGYGDFILVLSKVEERNELAKLQRQENVVLLEKPFQESDLLGITDKILRREDVRQRLYPRFEYFETAGIETFGVSGKIGAQIRKISKGGALLQLKGHALLRLGDLIQVHLHLDKLSRYHLIPARIVNTIGGEVITPNDFFGIEWLPQLHRKQVA